MAFATRIGSALRSKTSAHSNSSLLQAVRCMSSSKLFVAGLSYATDENSLKNAFSHYGTVLDARVVVDRDSGRSRGFGFITYSTSEDAAAAVTAMDGKELQGRTLKVDYANDRAGGIRGGGGGSFTSGNGYAAGGYGSTGGYESGGYGSGAGGYGSHNGGYAGSGGYSDGATGGAFASNYNNASGGTGGYASNAGYSNSATASGYGRNYNNTYHGGSVGGNGGYGSGANGGEYASSYNNVSGHETVDNSAYRDRGTNGFVTNYNDTSAGKSAGGNGGYATSYNNTSGGGKYASGNHGYGDATGGYATNNASGSNYKNASGGGYGINGSYNTFGNFDGNTGGYNSPNIDGAWKKNTGAAGSGTLGEFSGSFSRGDSGSAGLNNGNNISRSATGGSTGETMGFGSNKVQYNGQDDLLGEDFFDDKEAAGNL